MMHTELQMIQDRINFDGPSMAACLGLSYEQYRHLYYGHTKISPKVERAALALESKNKALSARWQPGGAYEQELNEMYPHGIPSVF